jgi:hypothetical protein
MYEAHHVHGETSWLARFNTDQRTKGHVSARFNVPQDRALKNSNEAGLSFGRNEKVVDTLRNEAWENKKNEQIDVIQ